MSDAVAEIMEVLVIINSKGRMQRKTVSKETELLHPASGLAGQQSKPLP